MDMTTDRPIITEPSAMTATERSRLFRARNPSYDARRKATERARAKAAVLQSRLAAQAELAAQLAAERRGPLLLPAPVESLDLQMLAAAMKRREAVAVER